MNIVVRSPAVTAVRSPSGGVRGLAEEYAAARRQTGAWLTLGLVGFIVWVVFVATACVSLLRANQHHAKAASD